LKNGKTRRAVSAISSMDIPLAANANLEEDSLIRQEPDDSALAQTSGEWNELVNEEPLEILEDPSIAMELSEDPVRLYLKEIGQIHLLDADSEFRLAARIEAQCRIDSLESGDAKKERPEGYYRSLYRSLCVEVIESWQKLQANVSRMGQGDFPDLALTLAGGAAAQAPVAGGRALLPAHLPGQRVVGQGSKLGISGTQRIHHISGHVLPASDMATGC